MNITVNSQLLAQELRLLNHVVPAKPALPILMNVLLRATDDTLQFYATDLEIGFRTSCAATVTEQGNVTLPAKTLLDLVEQLPNADVQIVTDKAHVRVMSGAFKSRLQTLSAIDFPTVPTVEGTASSLPTIALQSMITRVRYAVSDKTKYMINGALLTLTPSVIALVATDGKRLSIVTAAQREGQTLTAIIPTKTLDALLVLFTDESLDFSQSDRHLFFAAGDRLLISRALEGTFPQYQRIIPRESDKHATIDRATLSAAFKRVGLIADVNKSITLMFEPQALLITTSSAETGDAFERVPITYDGLSVKLSMNWQYLLDFLNVASGSSIVCDFKDGTTPLLLSDGDAFINVIMLMRS